MKSNNKKIRPVISALLSGLFILTSCNNHSEEKAEMRSLPAEMAVSAEAEISAGMEESSSLSSDGLISAANKSSAPSEHSNPSDKNGHTTKEKKIIKDGSLSLKSKELVDSKLRMDALVKSLNGYYEYDNFSNDSYRMVYDMRIRIPSGNFEKLLSSIEASKEEVINKNISARDVTEEFVDIETRLATKRDYLKRYRELLGRAANVKEILEIEEQIRVLQEEIESQEGRLKYLSDQVSFSSLSVNLFQVKEFTYTPHEEASFFERVKSSLARGWSAIVIFTLSIITVWPFIIIGVFVWLGFRRWNKKKKAVAVNK
jgi:hypothetical protein